MKESQSFPSMKVLLRVAIAAALAAPAAAAKIRAPAQKVHRLFGTGWVAESPKGFDQVMANDSGKELAWSRIVDRGSGANPRYQTETITLSAVKITKSTKWKRHSFRKTAYLCPNSKVSRGKHSGFKSYSHMCNIPGYFESHYDVFYKTAKHSRRYFCLSYMIYGHESAQPRPWKIVTPSKEDYPSFEVFLTMIDSLKPTGKSKAGPGKEEPEERVPLLRTTPRGSPPGGGLLQ